MTRKDFVLIAEAIQSYDFGEVNNDPKGREIQASVARHFAAKLQTTNPRFDAERFVEAATK